MTQNKRESTINVKKIVANKIKIKLEKVFDKT